MTITIDSAGRIVVPKAIRDHLGLAAGTELEIAEADGKFTLTPVRNTSGLTKRDGRWVFSGKLPPAFDLQKFIEDEREERIKKQGGW